jgi:Tfp pilus assembly protein PilX
MTRRSQIPRALAAQQGFAIPTALAVLLITFVLAGVATAVAVHTNRLSNRDTGAKTALEAADAGVRAAIYRLNMYRPASNYCPTVPTSYQVGTNGAPTASLCPPDGPESLGNGASFEYWMSRALVAGDVCAGVAVDSSQSDIAQRCITATGTLNGVSARVQERVAAYTSTPVFPTAIFGTKSVSIGNNVNIASDVLNTPALIGTNGSLTVGGGTTVIDGYQLPPGATTSFGNGVTNLGPTTGISQPYPVPTSIDPLGTSQNTASPYDLATTFQQGTCLKPVTWVTAWTQTNCNYRILCPHVQSCDTSSGGVTAGFDPIHRTLSLPNNSSLVLGGGVYNFCSLTLGNNSVITIAPGAHTSIYIDSPSDPNSGTPGSLTNPPCAAGTGTFTMSQNSTLNAGGSALNAQIYVYGDPNDSPPTNQVNLTNNGSSAFALAAPFSNINLSPSNNTIFVGAMIGYTVTLGQKSHFTFESDTNSLQSGALKLYYRTFFEQCPAVSTTGDPTSGC